MKRTNILITFSTLVVFFLFSCDVDDPTKDKTSTITVEAEDNQTEIEQGETLSFIVKNQNQKELTENVTIFVDGTKIDGLSYQFEQAKEYNVYAEYNGIKSPELVINVIVPIPPHTTKVLLEEFTATWCGYCPLMAYRIEQIIKDEDNVIPVVWHAQDQFDKVNGLNSLMSILSVRGFPSGKINRKTSWSNWDRSDKQVLQYLPKKVNLGLAIQSSIDENELSAKIKVHYTRKSATKNKLVVYLVENKLLASQANYYDQDKGTPFYGKGNPLQNFEHNHVVRLAMTDIFGDEIPEDKNKADETYEKDLKATIPSYVKDKTNLEIVAFVVDNYKKVINVQKAKVGEDKDFD